MLLFDVATSILFTFFVCGVSLSSVNPAKPRDNSSMEAFDMFSSGGESLCA